MRFPDPSEIDRADVDVVAEQEGVGDVRIAERRETCYAEVRVTSVKRVGSIGSRNIQCCQAVVGPDIHVLRIEPHPGVTHIAVEKQRGSYRVGAAEPGALDATGAGSRLTAI